MAQYPTSLAGPMLPAIPGAPAIPTVPGIGGHSQRKKKRDQYIDPITDEEASSLLGMVMGGLSAVGNIADLPASSARDILSGENPFDQWLSPISAENRTRGVDMLRNMGLADDEDTWGNFAGGLAMEIALDPLIWLTGPLGTFAKGSKAATAGKAASKAGGKAGILSPVPGKAVRSFKGSEDLADAAKYFKETVKPGSRPRGVLPKTPAAVAEQVRRGERGLVGVNVPFTNKQLWSWGQGQDWAARLLEHGFYGGNRLSDKTSLPIRMLRSKISHSAAGKGDLSGAVQKALDLQAAEKEALHGALMDVAPVLAARRNTLYKTFEKVADFHNADGDMDSFNEIMRSLSEAKQGIETTSQRFNRAFDIDAAMPGSDGGLRELIDSSDEYIDAMVDIKDAAHKRNLELGGSEKMLDNIFKRHFPRRGDYLDEMSTKEARRDILNILPGGTTAAHAMSKDELVTGRFRSPPPELAGKELKAWKKAYEVEKTAADKARTAWLQSHASQTDMLRGLTAEQRTHVLKGLKVSQRADLYLFQKHIDPDLLRATDNGTRSIFHGGGEEAVEHTYESLRDEWLGILDSKGKVVEPGRIRELGHYFANKPRKMLEKGLFNHTELEDWDDYMHAMLATESTLRTTRKMMLEKGVISSGTKPDHVRLSEAWSEAGLGGKKGNGLQSLIREAGLDPKQVDDLVVPRPIADALKGYADAMEPSVQAKIDKFMMGYDKMLAAYRGSFTTPWPSFHARNLISGNFQEMTAGKLNVKQILGGKWAALKYKMGDDNALEYIDEILHTSKILDSKGEIADLVGEASAREVGNAPTRGLFGALEPWKEAFTLGKGNWDVRNMRGVRRHSQEIAEAAKKGKRFDHATGKLVDIAKGETSDVKLNMWSQTGENMYADTEFLLRAGYYEALRKAGHTAEQASKFVREAHFDYSQLSQWEKTWARRGALFYTWKRKSAPYTLQVLLEKPGGAKAQALRAMNLATQGKDYMPRYLQEQGAMPWGASEGEEGKATFLRQGGLPLEDLNMLAIRNTLGGTAQRTAERLFSDTNPVMTAALEGLTGRQLRTGRKLRDLSKRSEKYFGTPMPWMDRGIAMSPLSRAVGEAEKFANITGLRESGRTPFEDVLNAATGMRFTTVDTERYKAMDALQALRDQLDDEAMVRESNRPYVPQRYREDVSPEVLKMLDRMRELEVMSRRKK